jgi:hypothetical protein
LCGLALFSPPRSRSGVAVPRTSGTELPSVDLTCWPNALFPTTAVPLVCANSAARATNPTVERFYTTAEPVRERITEGWPDSTLTTKETFWHMVGGKSVVPSPVSRRGVAGSRQRAVFCQARSAHRSCLFAFDGCGRPAWSGGLRRFQD